MESDCEAGVVEKLSVGILCMLLIAEIRFAETLMTLMGCKVVVVSMFGVAAINNVAV